MTPGKRAERLAKAMNKLLAANARLGEALDVTLPEISYRFAKRPQDKLLRQCEYGALCAELLASVVRDVDVISDAIPIIARLLVEDGVKLVESTLAEYNDAQEALKQSIESSSVAEKARRELKKALGDESESEKIVREEALAQAKTLDHDRWIEAQAAKERQDKAKLDHSCALDALKLAKEKQAQVPVMIVPASLTVADVIDKANTAIAKAPKPPVVTFAKRPKPKKRGKK